MAKVQATAQSAPRHDSFGGCLTNLFWMIACPAALVMTAMAIAVGHKPGLGGLDVLYWAVVVLAPVARHLEARAARSRSPDSDAEVAGTWRRYTLSFAAVAAGLWLAAHGIAYVGGR